MLPTPPPFFWGGGGDIRRGECVYLYKARTHKTEPQVFGSGRGVHLWFVSLVFKTGQDTHSSLFFFYSEISSRLLSELYEPVLLPTRLFHFPFFFYFQK